MKTCPKCLTQYTDDTLVYCLQDGSALSAATQAGTPTVVLGETETLVRPREGGPVPETQPSLSGDAVRSGTSAPTPRRSSTVLAVAITALLMILVFGVLGIAAFLYFKNRVADNRDLGATTNRVEDLGNIPVSSPSMSPLPSPRSPAPSPTPERAAAVDEETRDDVISEIDSWRDITEDMDLDALMGHYAPRVDYYNRRGADIGFIRADKSRAFSRFTDIRMKLSNIQLTPDDSGNRITAVFDKEWAFSGERTTTGKVRQLLELKKIDGRWLITAERDLKVY